MAHQRNVGGLRSNAKKKSLATLQRANEAIQQLLKQARPVNFKTVAEIGGVSVPYLYGNKTLRERIEYLRNQYQPKFAIQPSTTVSDASKEAMLAALRAQIKELRRENETLRRQIEVAYGLVYQQSNSGKMDQPTSDDC
jgi:hypothetical protein